MSDRWEVIRWRMDNGFAEPEWYAGLLAERDELLAALKAARDALYNGFEPDNQSRAWHAANNAVAAAERLAGDKTE